MKESALERLVGAALWASGLAWLVPSLGALTVLHRWFSLEQLEPLSRLYCAGQIAAVGSRWRAVSHASLDGHRPYLFVQNHTNLLDHVFAYRATSHPKQGVELASHFRYPVYGWFMKQRGTIPVDPTERGRTNLLLERCRAEVTRGRSLLAFPEGTRTLTGAVGPFKTGLFFVARDLGLEVVPLAARGAFRLMRKGSWVIRPGGTVEVHVGPPMPAAGLSDAGVAELAADARAWIHDALTR
jgi:1-acyl-sn-glycerol-3-phosphate acyltransferase